jgi:glutamine synthetase
VASAGNDHRLGANEAPPAIISIFLGEQLSGIIEQLAGGGARKGRGGGMLRIGVSHLPALPRDLTDRNRTSPFAFTGNKFEFRMVGASLSCAGPMFVLNTIVADVLREIADELEGARDVNPRLQKILRRIATEHKRVIFNGNNYSQEWLEEAGRRGLPNLNNSVDALDVLREKESIALFERHGVLSRTELLARHEIFLETYVKTLNIEALAASRIARRQILPAVMGYAGSLARDVSAIRDAGCDAEAASKTLRQITSLMGELSERLEALERARDEAAGIEDVHEKAVAFRDSVAPALAALRAKADALELLVDARAWPLPTYAEMLFAR